MIRALALCIFLSALITYTITYPRAYEAGLAYGDFGHGKAAGRQETLEICDDLINDAVDEAATLCADYILEDCERRINADLYY